MPTVVRALLDRDPPPTLHALWRDRDLIGPLLGLLAVVVILRDLAHRLNHRSHSTTWSIPAGGMTPRQRLLLGVTT